MPTFAALTIDDFDAELKKQAPTYADMDATIYGARRTRAYSLAIADYQESLAQADDLFVRADNSSSPITTGTEKMNTSVGDVYAVTLPTGARRVRGDAILVAKASSAIFFNVPRIELSAIIASGGSQTPYAFYELNGKLMLYTKDGNFDNTASVILPYYRALDVTTTTTTVLDIKQQDFLALVASTIEKLKL